MRRWIVILVALTSACTAAHPGVTTSSTTTTRPSSGNTTTTTSPPPPGSIRVGDDSGLITVRVPTTWTDVLGAEWERAGSLIGPALSASPNRDLWSRGWGTPGVFVGASGSLTTSASDVLDAENFSADCLYRGRERYVEEPYGGQVDQWSDCGREGSDLYVAAIRPPSRAFIVFLQIIITPETPPGTLELILGSVRVALADDAPSL